MDTAAGAATELLLAAPLAGSQPPAPVPDWYAVYTRARHEKVLARELERRGLAVMLRQGMRVRVVRGPLAGVEGVLADRRRPAAVVVSISALASSVRAEIPLEDVEPT